MGIRSSTTLSHSVNFGSFGQQLLALGLLVLIRSSHVQTLNLVDSSMQGTRAPSADTNIGMTIITKPMTTKTEGREWSTYSIIFYIRNELRMHQVTAVAQK